MREAIESKPARATAGPSDPLLALGLFVALLAVWEALTRLLGVQTWLLPPPSAIGTALVRDFRPILLRHTLVTLQEIVIGFGLGGGLGLLLGILLAYFPRAERILSPFVVAVQTTPKIALAPLFVVWFGFGITSKIIIVMLIAFFPLMINALAGFMALDPSIEELMRSLKSTPRQIFLKARLPNAMPSILAGARIAIVQSVVGAVAAEFVGAKEGLGYLVVYAGSLLQTDRVFAVLAMLLLVGLALYWAAVALERRLVSW